MNDAGDDDKLQNLSATQHAYSTVPPSKALTDPKSDYSPTTAADCSVQESNAPSDLPATSGQQSTRTCDVPEVPGSPKTTSDAAHDANCSSLSCQHPRQHRPNSNQATPSAASPNACASKVADAVEGMEVQCMCLTSDSGQHRTEFDLNLVRVICDLAGDAGSAAVVVGAGTDDVPAAVDSAPVVPGQ